MGAYIFGLIIGGIINGCIWGAITKIINEGKGYRGGFAWGFWLGLIGVIVVACKTNLYYVNQMNTASNLSGGLMGNQGNINYTGMANNNQQMKNTSNVSKIISKAIGIYFLFMFLNDVYYYFLVSPIYSARDYDRLTIGIKWWNYVELLAMLSIGLCFLIDKGKKLILVPLGIMLISNCGCVLDSIKILKNCSKIMGSKWLYDRHDLQNALLNVVNMIGIIIVICVVIFYLSKDRWTGTIANILWILPPAVVGILSVIVELVVAGGKFSFINPFISAVLLICIGFRIFYDEKSEMGCENNNYLYEEKQ